ncbi:putative NAD(P)/FAD-binding protein YdhS [Actinokineospora baliensis]|uniref:FAD/NAD(P)-binding protein n=1 Tax=Actinokineospora baliensis TaxID=547056 RepID=UPI001956DA29|nr:FAD/NAD(P)-binding protein [Actinokineospora baliensis]MBM7772922.1 putative NAD(P)/FAD-binding protein YdhS [Actinokineospora baliensis]
MALSVDPSRTGRIAVCVVGMGPRGLSVLERICANARDFPRVELTVHVVDPHHPGAGDVWRTSQDRQLLLNTVASQVSMFTDDSVELAGRLEVGPSLYEWARFLVLMGNSEGYPEEVLAQARELGPDSYPSRSFYGHYLKWVFRRVVRQAPGTVRVEVHRSRAVSLEDATSTADGPQTVLLEDGTRLDDLAAVILAQGHVRVRPSATEQTLSAYAAEHGLTYVLPSNPADVDLSSIQPGTAVALRGLGLNFFDHLALFTLARGGRFERVDGRLVYRASGREPKLYAGSRRGVPYHARGENEKGPSGRHDPVIITPEVIAGLRARGGIDFQTDLWPLVAKETETVYYTTLITQRECGCVADRFRERYLDKAWGDPAEALLLDEYGIPTADRWDWERIATPYRGQVFADQEAFQEWLLDYLRADAVRAGQGNVTNPLKAALDVMRDLRNEIRLVVDHNGLSGQSHRDHLDGHYTPLNAFLSIGPPAARIEQTVALIEAGVLQVMGPGVRVRADTDQPGFVLESPAVPGSVVRATVLIEARLQEIDLRRTADPLLGRMLASGQCRLHRVGEYETGGLAVTARPYRVIDADDRAHPRRFACGVPTESVHWVTAAGIRPGVNSMILGDSDAISLACLTLGAPLPHQVESGKLTARSC